MRACEKNKTACLRRYIMGCRWSFGVGRWWLVLWIFGALLYVGWWRLILEYTRATVVSPQPSITFLFLLCCLCSGHAEAIACHLLQTTVKDADNRNNLQSLPHNASDKVDMYSSHTERGYIHFLHNTVTLRWKRGTLHLLKSPMGLTDMSQMIYAKQNHKRNI